MGLTNTRKNFKTNKELDINIVSERLKEIRQSLKYTMQMLADKFDTSSSAISNYENMKYLILSSFLIELCKFSNYSIDYVLGRTDERKIR